MKINKLSFVVGLVVVVFGSGCVGIGNGNVGKNIQPPPYGEGEKSIVVHEKKHIDADGKVTSDIDITTKSGLAVSEGVINKKTDMVRDVKVSEAGGGLLTRIFTPTPGLNNGFSGQGGSLSNPSLWTPVGQAR